MKVRRYTYSINYDQLPSFHKRVASLAIHELTAYEFDQQVIIIIDISEDGNETFTQSVNSVYNPLERIYELDQTVVYPSAAGQLKTPIHPKKRYLSQLNLIRDDQLIQDYKKVHSIGMAWPEVTNNMKSVGVLDMELYLDGYSAFLMMDVPVNFDPVVKGKVWSTLPREQEWQTYVAKYQNIDPSTSVQDKWKPLPELAVSL